MESPLFSVQDYSYLASGGAIGVFAFLLTRSRTRQGADIACRTSIKASLNLFRQAAKWEKARPREQKGADQSLVDAYKDLRAHIYAPPLVAFLATFGASAGIHATGGSWLTCSAGAFFAAMLYWQSISGVVTAARSRIEKMKAGSERIAQATGSSVGDTLIGAVPTRVVRMVRAAGRALDWARSVSSITYATAIRTFAEEFARSEGAPNQSHIRSVTCTSGIIAYLTDKYHTQYLASFLHTYFRPDLANDSVSPVEAWLAHDESGEIHKHQESTRQDSEPAPHVSDTLLLRALAAVSRQISKGPWILDQMELELSEIKAGHRCNRRRHTRHRAAGTLNLTFFKAKSGEITLTVPAILLDESDHDRGFWIQRDHFDQFKLEMQTVPVIRHGETGIKKAKRVIQPIRFQPMVLEKRKGFRIGAYLRDVPSNGDISETSRQAHDATPQTSIDTLEIGESNAD